MRTFIVLCLVAAACADKLGYNYQPVGHSNSGLSFGPGSSSNVAPSYASQGDYSAPANVGSSYAPQGGFDASTNDAPSYAPQAEFDKEFLTYTANDEDFNEDADPNKYAESLKQGIRVVFIKGPESNGLEKAALALAKQAAEQKTDIYVLNKQADLNSLSNKLNNLNKNNNNKPEVHFVKYNTPEDAANAQKAIQGQYDALGGRSHSVNGGVAPVLNFASNAPVAAASAPAPVSEYTDSAPVAASGPAPVSSYIPPSSDAEDSEPSNSYLPASILRLFRL